MRVPRPGRLAAHHDPDQAATVTDCRSDQIESTLADVAGLDSIHAGKVRHEGFVIDIKRALPLEAFCREEAVLDRKIAAERARQCGEITCARHLLGIGQSRCVAEYR